ncbi:MAG: adenylosuccinate synthetase, partial [Promethearchaeota archaeon]
FDEEAIVQEYLGYGKELKGYMKDTAYYLNKLIDDGKRVLFEGAQGTLLGIDHGMYPFGTSSNTWAGGISSGAGVSPKKISQICGVIKAYTSRVGGGVVPTELDDVKEFERQMNERVKAGAGAESGNSKSIKDVMAELRAEALDLSGDPSDAEIGRYIRFKGHEFGTTTNRPRRVGWIDLVNLKYACMLNDFDFLAITLLDVLGGLPKVKICTHYIYHGEKTENWPIQSEIIKECKPYYIETKGWKDLSPEEWSEIAKGGYEQLPDEAKEYIRILESELKKPISIISVGANREDTIIRSKIW